MNTDVRNTAGKIVVPAKEEMLVKKNQEFSQVIWEKKMKVTRPRFTTADLWNIRRNARRFSIYK